MSYLLPRLVGEARAKELMLTNRKLSANEALAWGLINAVVPDGELAAAAETLALRLAAGPTRAYGTVKQLLQASACSSLEAQLDREARGIADNAMGVDGQEGVKAFLGKRKAKFQGR
jgi:2-(1,2-epoxy-1,2-dihydrophenyl)acetyl-CoA isomerase